MGTTIGVLGGTGPAGRGIAARLASVGYDVVIECVGAARTGRGRWPRSCGHGGVTGSPALTNGRERRRGRGRARRHRHGVGRRGTDRGRLRRRARRDQGRHLDGGERPRQGRPTVPSDAAPEGSLAAGGQGNHARRPRRRRVPARSGAALGTSTIRSRATSSSWGDDDGAGAVLDLVVGIPNLRAFDGGSLANAIGIEAFSAALLTVNLRHQGEATLHLAGIGPRLIARPGDGDRHDDPPLRHRPDAGRALRARARRADVRVRDHAVRLDAPRPRRHVPDLRPAHPPARGARPRGADGAQRHRRRRLDPAEGPRARRAVPRARRGGAGPVPLRHGRARHPPAGGRAARHRVDRRDDRHDQQLLDPGTRTSPTAPSTSTSRRSRASASCRTTRATTWCGSPASAAATPTTRTAATRSTSCCGSRRCPTSRRGARRSASAARGGTSSAR